MGERFVTGFGLYLAVGIFTLGLFGQAYAQQTLELPQPAAQPTTRYNRGSLKPLPHSQNVQTIPVPLPKATAAPPPPSFQNARPGPPVQDLNPGRAVSQPALPPEFRGCWQGRVSDVDWIESFPGAPLTGPWLPKTYLLCYRRTGSGPFQLTFMQAGIEGTSQITNSGGQVRIQSTDGRNYAAMMATLHFDELRRNPGVFTSPSFAVDEFTSLDCSIGYAGMSVSGNVFGRRDRAPWFRAGWHSIFVRVSDLPE